ncbi:MAG: IclR family transcriptional regulator [Peptococcaceae bacterium]|nr:IclR family transcriptional regulator [Peptococcaceae bacterium]
MAQHFPENSVHSVERALAILEALGQKTQGFGCTELGQLLGLHKSTVHRLISTLQAFGFVEKDPRTERYKLGTKLIYLGLEALNGLDFRKIAIPYMQELMEISRETVQLAVLDGGEVLFLERDQSPEAITVNLGLRGPVYCTSEGKVLLAYLKEENVSEILGKQEMRQFTINTITEVNQFISHLEKVRSQGFAINAEEMVEGVRSIAAPVYNHTGKVIAALSITGPSTRLSLERIYRLVTVLKETCTSISMQMGYRGEPPGNIPDL